MLIIPNFQPGFINIYSDLLAYFSLILRTLMLWGAYVCSNVFDPFINNIKHQIEFFM